MTNAVEELKKDIAELTSLQKLATRPKIADLLSLQTRKLITDLVNLEEQQQSTAVKSPSSQSLNAATKHYQVKLDNYAWDQTSKAIKFYVTLPKVHTISAENVQCNFTDRSLELIVKDLENKDFVFTIKKLLNAINPEQSTWKIKTDTILITAAKVESTNWSHVTEIEKKASDSKKIVPDEKSNDPSEGLMSIMRNMYEQGDDEMKRTIAKAWTESQMKNNVL